MEWVNHISPTQTTSVSTTSVPLALQQTLMHTMVNFGLWCLAIKIIWQNFFWLVKYFNQKLSRFCGIMGVGYIMSISNKQSVVISIVMIQNQLSTINEHSYIKCFVNSESECDPVVKTPRKGKSSHVCGFSLHYTQHIHFDYNDCNNEKYAQNFYGLKPGIYPVIIIMHHMLLQPVLDNPAS